MYYHNNPSVMETDDIAALEYMEVSTETDPPTAKLIVRLHGRTPFVPKMLHLTNGVDHRLLTPERDTEEVPAPEQEWPQGTVDEEAPLFLEGEKGRSRESREEERQA